ncbi:hypothetical protein ACLB2K_032313 [Fragaria x ananassa]
MQGRPFRGALASVRRWQILKDNVKGLTLKPLSTTRWESHIESVKPLRFFPVEIREALLQLADIDKKDFMTTSKLLQSDDMQISVAIGEVKGLIAWLDHYRESGFNAALVDASDMAEKLNVPAVFPEKRPIKRPRFFDESTSEPSPPSSAERSFSKLKLLKNYLRSTMSQDRLNGLALISIENECLGDINLDKVVDDFAAKKARRRIFK